MLAHADARVRRSGIRALVALVEPGDPEITIKLALWLEAAAPVQDEPGAAGTHVCASHTATVSYCYVILLQYHTATVLCASHTATVPLMCPHSGTNVCEYAANVWAFW